MKVGNPLRKIVVAAAELVGPVGDGVPQCEPLRIRQSDGPCRTGIFKSVADIAQQVALREVLKQRVARRPRDRNDPPTELDPSFVDPSPFHATILRGFEAVGSQKGRCAELTLGAVRAEGHEFSASVRPPAPPF